MVVINNASLLVVSLCVFIIASYLQKKVKLPPPLFYLIVSFLIGSNGFNVFNSHIFPSLNSYNSAVLLLLFTGAGFALNLRTMRSTGKIELKMSTLPVFSEFIIIALILYFGLGSIPELPWHLTLAESVLIASLFAMSAPAEVIPITMGHIMNGKTGKNDVASVIVVTAILDNFTPILFTLVGAALFVGPSMGLGSNVTVVIAISCFAIVAFSLAGFTLSFIIYSASKKLSSLLEKNAKLNLLFTLAIFCVFVVILNLLRKVDALAGLIGIFSILMAMFLGSGLKFFLTEGLAKKTQMNFNKLFGIFGMPIVFLSIGSKVDLLDLRNLTIISVLFLVVLIALAVKLIVGYLSLGKDYSLKEKKYFLSCFIPKGVTLINFGVLLAVLLPESSRGSAVEFMILLATLAIPITQLLGVSLMSLKGDNWLKA